MTQDELKSLLHYDHETGIFTWLNDSKKGGFKAGRKCTCKDVHGYIQINIFGSPKKAHRLAWLYMTGEWPKEQIDHINHDRLDNRFCNLKLANNIENHKNRPMQKNNTSGFVGVSIHKGSGLYTAKINVNKKQIHLGFFKDFAMAVEARKKANIKYGFSELHGVGIGLSKYKKQQKERQAA